MTPLQLKCLEYIRDEATALGTPPTFIEIAQHLGLRSKSGVARLVEALIEAGKLERDPRRPRGLRVVGQLDLSSVSTEAIRAELARRGITMEALLERPLPPGVGRPCAADGCDALVQPGRLMCRDHWTALPQDQRSEILGSFRRRDGNGYQTAVSGARDWLLEHAR